MHLLNLPDELLLVIGSQIQSQSDLAAISSANRYLHNLLIPELYHRDARTQKSVQWAARMGRHETLQKAQSFGIVSDLDTGPLLYLAAENGHVSILECLLPVQQDSVLNWLSSPQSAATPLAAACRSGHYGAARLLLKHGADHTITHYRDGGPLHLAVTFGCSIVVELLLDSGADISAAIAKSQWTPLHIACRNGNLAVAKLLVDRGVDISTGYPYWSPPFFTAVDSGNLELVKFLLSKGCDPMRRSSRGHTPLHIAAKRHLLDMSKLLISHGSQVCAKTDQGSTVLDWAAMRRGDAVMVTFLLEAGAEVGTTDTKGVSALHLAAANSSPEVLNVLLNAGYDVNLKTLDYGYTPLYQALHRGRVHSMEVLLARGADVNAEQGNGFTLLHAAAGSMRAEAVDAVRLLVEKGANTEARDSYGRSPLNIAISAENDDVVELLSGKGPIVSNVLHLNSRYVDTLVRTCTG